MLSALSHLVKCLQEEKIVYRLCRLSVCNLLARGKLGISDCEISERNIGAGYIEISGEIIIYFLKACYSVVIFRP